jgi:hypothetical protein
LEEGMGIEGVEVGADLAFEFLVLSLEFFVSSLEFLGTTLEVLGVSFLTDVEVDLAMVSM